MSTIKSILGASPVAILGFLGGFSPDAVWDARGEANSHSPTAAQTIQLEAISTEALRLNPNLVPNCGFEDEPSHGLPEGWRWDPRNTGASCTLDTQTAHSGRRSIRLTNGTAFGAHVYGTLWHTRAIRLESGRSYTLSAWVKSDSPGQAGLIGGSTWQFRVPVPPTAGQWKRIWTPFTPGEKDRDFILRINTESPTPGVWFDDLKLEEGEPTPVQPAGDAASAIQLEALKPAMEIQGDGPFALVFTGWTPRPLSCGAELSIDTGESLHKTVSLVAGAWRINVKGRSTATDDAPRVATLRLKEEGKELAGADSSLRFYSSSRAMKRLAKLKNSLPALQNEMDGVKARGQDLAYPTVTYTVLTNFIGYAEEDANRNETQRCITQIGDLERMAARLERELNEALVAQRTFPAVPRWTGTQRPVVKSSSFLAPAVVPGGAPHERPIFFNGFGHFGQVVNDMEKWPSYGANIIQIEFGPQGVFPSEGVTNDTPMVRMRQTLDRAQKAGVAVCLLISPHYFPGWALDKWPHLRKKRDGFLQFCLHAPESQTLLRQYVLAALAPLKDHPALHSVCLANEPVNKEEPCEHGTRQWHAWLQKRHPDLATLNARWGAQYSAFDDAPLPNPFGPRPATPVWMDFIRFNQEFFAGWHKMLADAVHQAAPGLPVHTKAMTWTFLNDGDIVYGVDATLFGQLSDINGNDAVNGYSFGRGDFAQGWEMNAMGHDLQRSVLDAPVCNTENHLITDRDTRYVPPEHIRAALWQAAVHGQSATAIWVWERAFDPKSDCAGSIMHRPACAEAVGIVNHDLNRAALELTDLQQAAPQVLLLQSLTAAVWENGSYRDCLGKLYTALSFTGLKIGFITERQLESGIIPTAPVILVPNIIHLSDAALNALQKFPGRLVLVGDALLLTHNDYGQPRPAPLQGERIAYRHGPTSWRDLWKVLLPKLPALNLHPAVQLLDPAGQPIWGVEWRTVERSSNWVVNLCNYRQEPVRFKLVRNKETVDAIDVLNGDLLSGTMTLQPLEVKLVHLAFPPAPSR